MSLSVFTPPPAAGLVYLNPPPGGARDAVHELLADRPEPTTEPFPGVLAVAYPTGGLTALADALHTQLDARLQRATRSLVLPANAVPTVFDLLNAQPLAEMLAGIRSGWLAEVVRAERLVTHFQPIVDAADPGSVHGYRISTPSTSRSW